MTFFGTRVSAGVIKVQIRRWDLPGFQVPSESNDWCCPDERKPERDDTQAQKQKGHVRTVAETGQGCHRPEHTWDHPKLKGAKKDSSWSPQLAWGLPVPRLWPSGP